MSKRKCYYHLSDLIEQMIVNIIKELQLKENIDDFEIKINDLINDINSIFDDHNTKISSSSIRKIIALTIINLFIWREKDLMWGEKGDEHLKLSHQLNGIRNQIKNTLFLDNNYSDTIKTNVNVDNLKGWRMSL